MKPTTRSWMNEWLGRRRCQIDCCWQIQQKSKAAGGTFCFKIRVVGEIPDNNAVDERQEEEEEIPDDAVVSRTWKARLRRRRRRSERFLKFMLSFQPGLERQNLEVQENLVAPRIELVRLRIECGIVMHRSEVREYHPSFGYYQFPCQPASWISTSSRSMSSRLRQINLLYTDHEAAVS